MKRTGTGRAFGLRTTPDDLRSCLSFLRTAARFVLRGCPESAVRVPWTLGRIAGKPASLFRRRP